MVWFGRKRCFGDEASYEVSGNTNHDLAPNSRDEESLNAEPLIKLGRSIHEKLKEEEIRTRA